MTDKQIKKIEEWVNSSHAYLSERTDYARGYKAGIARAKLIIEDILSD